MLVKFLDLLDFIQMLDWGLYAEAERLELSRTCR